MNLERGQAAPLFATFDMYDNPIVLKKFRGHKVLLSFFRYASCPLCNLRVKQIMDLFPKFEKHDLQILAVFHSSKQNMLKNVGTMEPPFPLIPDPEAQLYKLYSVETSKYKAMRGMLKLILEIIYRWIK
jgi:peroxiredoxin Q/BCP